MFVEGYPVGEVPADALSAFARLFATDLNTALRRELERSTHEPFPPLELTEGQAVLLAAIVRSYSAKAALGDHARHLGALFPARRD